MSDHFEWSESGLRLLDEINKVIQDNGGRIEMYYKVVAELQETLYVRDKVMLKRKIKLLKENRVSVEHIPYLLGISEFKMFCLLDEMGMMRTKKRLNNLVGI